MASSPRLPIATGGASGPSASSTSIGIVGDTTTPITGTGMPTLMADTDTPTPTVTGTPTSDVTPSAGGTVSGTVPVSGTAPPMLDGSAIAATLTSIAGVGVGPTPTRVLTSSVPSATAMVIGPPLPATATATATMVSPTLPATATAPAMSASPNPSPAPLPALPSASPSASPSAAAPVSGSVAASVTAQLAALPLSFEPNVGQADSHARFLAHGAGYRLFLTGTDAMLALTVPPTSTAPGSATAAAAALAASAAGVLPARIGFAGTEGLGRLLGLLAPTMPLSATAVRLRYLGVNPNPIVEGQDPLPGTANYFIGHDPSGWHTGVPTYARVVYHNIYPGVDLAYHGTQGHLEYDWTVAPGASVAAIAYAIDGAPSVDLAPSGDLRLRTLAGTVSTLAPSAYQTIKGQRHAVSSAFVLTGANLVGVVVGAHDATQPLVIDPVLGYSTYLGGAGGSTSANGVAVDASGSAYVAGLTSSNQFPTQNALTNGSNGSTYQGGNNDVVVTKFAPDGRTLLYSTYLGGGDDDQGLGIAVNAAGNAYVAGFTWSSGTTAFPTTPGAYQTLNAGGGHNDAFVAELGTGGNSLVYSTYLGGGAYDAGQAIAIDGSGAAYVTGPTVYDNPYGAFPTTSGAYQTSFQGGDPSDGWVTKLKPDGSGLVYSTFLGGSGSDNPTGIAVDASGAAYVAGTTTSHDFPRSSNPLQSSYNGGSHDAFVTKLLPDGSNVSYSTYLGAPGSPGTQDDEANAIAVDSAGAAYVVGETSSGTFPTTPGAYRVGQAYGGGAHDAFVLKLAPGGGSLAYGTLLGGGGDDNAVGIALDGGGAAYVIGDTTSGDFPTLAPLQGRTAYYSNYPNVFVAALGPGGNALRYSTYLGGGAQDFGTGIAVDSVGEAYVAGKTYSVDFPVANAYSPVAVSGSNPEGFLARINPIPTITTTVDDGAQGTDLGQFTYVGGWSHCTAPPGGANCNALYYNNTNSADATANDAATLQFSGSGVQYYATRDTNRGIAAVSVDGGPETMVDLYGAQQGNVLAYTSPPLANGVHTLTVRVTGTQDSSSGGAYVTIDRADIIAPTTRVAAVNSGGGAASPYAADASYTGGTVHGAPALRRGLLYRTWPARFQRHGQRAASPHQFRHRGGGGGAEQGRGLRRGRDRGQPGTDHDRLLKRTGRPAQGERHRGAGQPGDQHRRRDRGPVRGGQRRERRDTGDDRRRD